VTQQVFKTPAPRVRHNHGGNDEDEEREGEGEGEEGGDGDRSLEGIGQGMNELDLSINGALEEVVELEEETLEMQLEEEGWVVEYMPPRSIRECLAYLPFLCTCGWYSRGREPLSRG
jgi:hypothetical protein